MKKLSTLRRFIAAEKPRLGKWKGRADKTADPLGMFPLANWIPMTDLHFHMGRRGRESRREVVAEKLIFERAPLPTHAHTYTQSKGEGRTLHARLPNFAFAIQSPRTHTRVLFSFSTRCNFVYDFGIPSAPLKRRRSARCNFSSERDPPKLAFAQDARSNYYYRRCL